MIVLKDTIYKETTRRNRPVRNKLYRHFCDRCGADRGYQAKSFVTQSCNKCSKLGVLVSEQTKSKMSKAATKRYNNPNWQPTVKSEPFIGQRRKNYISRTTATQRKIRQNMKSLLWQKINRRSLNKKGSTFDLLGYTVDDIIIRLESQFQPGMSWDNYGRGGWHIDHIKPDSWFNYSSISDEQFKQSWCLSNLQPMWESENCSKGDRFIGVKE